MTASTSSLTLRGSLSDLVAVLPPTGVFVVVAVAVEVAAVAATAMATAVAYRSNRRRDAYATQFDSGSGPGFAALWSTPEAATDWFRAAVVLFALAFAGVETVAAAVSV